MNFKKSTILIVAAAMLTGFTACNSTSEDTTTYQPVYTTIATIERTGSSGTTFITREKDDSPEIIYTTTQTLKAEAKAGMRVGIQYYLPDGASQWQSGPITFTYVGECKGKGGELPIAKAEDSNNWYSDMIQDAVIWRTGKYINAMILVYNSVEPRVLNMTVDEATLKDKIPQIHLNYTQESISMMNPTIMFLSYDLSALFTKQGATDATEVEVHYDLKGDTKTLLIPRPQTSDYQ